MLMQLQSLRLAKAPALFRQSSRSSRTTTGCEQLPERVRTTLAEPVIASGYMGPAGRLSAQFTEV